uniref:SCP domain-containing protein n=1 Tax=Strongyloides venezuelensis TaxID=75913 RepID=A0A0K0FIZ0_STRVS
MGISIFVYVFISFIINLIKTQELAVTYMAMYISKHRKIYLYRDKEYKTIKELEDQMLKNHQYVDHKYLLMTKIPSIDNYNTYHKEEQMYRNIFTRKFLTSTPPHVIEEYYIRKKLEYRCNGRTFTSYQKALDYVLNEKKKIPIKSTRKPYSTVLPPLEVVDWAKERIYCKKVWLLIWKYCDYYCYSRNNFALMRKKFLLEINYYREKYGAGNLVECPQLSSYADKYLKEVVPLSSSVDITKFENVGRASLARAPLIVNHWFGERKKYNFNTLFGGMETRHFTAMVWKSLKKIGIGVLQAGDKIYVKIIYDKNVNLPNQFIKNVLRKVRG